MFICILHLSTVDNQHVACVLYRRVGLPLHRMQVLSVWINNWGIPEQCGGCIIKIIKKRLCIKGPSLILLKPIDIYYLCFNFLTNIWYFQDWYSFSMKLAKNRKKHVFSMTLNFIFKFLAFSCFHGSARTMVLAWIYIERIQKIVFMLKFIFFEVTPPPFPDPVVDGLSQHVQGWSPRGALCHSQHMYVKSIW